MKVCFCLMCKHFTGDSEKWTCAAFPDEIPEEFMLGDTKHKEVVPGQQGRYVHEYKTEELKRIWTDPEPKNVIPIDRARR